MRTQEKRKKKRHNQKREIYAEKNDNVKEE